MIREIKMTIKQVRSDSCDVESAVRDEYGAWESNGIIPMHGAFEEVKARLIANQEKWGWILSDIEEECVLTFWKEF